MSTTQELTGLQAVQYSLDHPGFFLTLTNNKITLVDKANLDTSKVVATTGWLVERDANENSLLDCLGGEIKSPIQLHIKGSYEEAEVITKKVTTLLTQKVTDESQLSSKEEYDSYKNLTQRHESKERFPWFHDQVLPAPKDPDNLSSNETIDLIQKEDFLNFLLEFKENNGKSLVEAGELFKKSFIERAKPQTSSTTFSSNVAMPDFIAACESLASDDSDSDQESIETQWVFVDPDVSPTKSASANPYLFHDYQPKVIDLVNLISDNKARSNYLSWDSKNNRFTLNPIRESDKGSFVFLKIEKQNFLTTGFYPSKGIYISKNCIEQFESTIKNDRIRSMELKRHLITNDYQAIVNISTTQI